MPSREHAVEPWVWGVAVPLTALGLGALGYGVVTLLRGSWPRLGDSCPLSTYQSVLASDTMAERAWQYMPWLRHAADAFGVDPTLVAGLVQTESAWNPNAGSSAGALGLGQQIKSTAKSLYASLSNKGRWPFGTINSKDPAEGYFAQEGYPNRIDRTDPQQSLWMAAALVRGLLDAGKGVEWALAAYNAGPKNANKPKSEWPNETQAYVPGVLKRQRKYQELAAACGRGALA